MSNRVKITPGMLMAAMRLNIPCVFVSGGPGKQEMLYPTSYLKTKGLDAACALVTDGRFSGGTPGLLIGHVRPEAEEGGLIEIDIPNRTIHLAADDATISARCEVQVAKGWKPAKPRPRKVSTALRAYAALTTSAAMGAVRKLPEGVCA